MKIALSATGGANRLSIAAASLVPGDTLQRALILTNATGNQALAGITLTTLATTASKLDTDPALGLQLAIDSCSVPWTPQTPFAA